MTGKATSHDVHIIGGGLAGSEAAWQLAQRGVRVRLSEMRGSGEMTPAHQTDGLAELVCSNSFRSDDATSNAVGVIHAEMRLAGSLIMACADKHQVPAGGALAVDRDGFSDAVTAAIQSHPLITVQREEITGLPPEEIAAVAREFKVFYEKVPTGDTYTISHSSTSYVYDTRGTLRLSLGHSLNAKECAEDLVTLMEIC